MKAITTKYVGPTAAKGARITAFDCDGNKTSICYPHELSGEAVYLKAAQTLAEKMGWTGNMVGGAVKGGYVFVFTEMKMLTNVAEYDEGMSDFFAGEKFSFAKPADWRAGFKKGQLNHEESLSRSIKTAQDQVAADPEGWANLYKK